MSLLFINIYVVYEYKLGKSIPGKITFSGQGGHLKSLAYIFRILNGGYLKFNFRLHPFIPCGFIFHSCGYSVRAKMSLTW